MEKGLLFFTISLGCLWLLLDDVYGDKRLSNILRNLTPDLSVKEYVQDGVAKAIGANENLDDELEKLKKRQEKNDTENAAKSKADQDLQKMMENILKSGRR